MKNEVLREVKTGDWFGITINSSTHFCVSYVMFLIARNKRQEILQLLFIKAGNYLPQNSVAEELPADWIWNSQEDCLY
jgi:hypothetical protein